MRVNIYAEEMTDQIEIIEKEVEGNKFTALRFYLYLPTTYYLGSDGKPYPVNSGKMTLGPDGEIKGPFLHRAGDDDSSAVTFWGKRDLRIMLRKALAMLDEHYGSRDPLRNNPVVGFMSEKQAEGILEEMRSERRSDI